MKLIQKQNSIITGGIVAIAALATISGAAVSAASASDSTVITVTVNPIISLSLDASSVTTTVDGNGTKTGVYTTATVSTNNLAGYTLTVADSDTTTALTGDNGSIPTGTSIAAGTAAWAIRGNTFGSHATTKLSTTSWTAMVASGSSITVVDSGTLTAAITESTKIEYGVSTAATTPAGTYSDTITFTATTKAS